MPTPYESMGGVEACRKLAETFYARVRHDPVLRPLFPGKTLRCAIEEFSAFLVQFLGGPAEHTQRRWWVSLRESHRRFPIGPREREAWMSHMRPSLDEVCMDESFRLALLNFFERSSAYLIDKEPAPGTVAMPPELSCRWSTQTTLDEAVAAIRREDPHRAIALAETAGIQPGLLVLMIQSGVPVLLEYVRGKVLSIPSLARERFNGRTLLHTAAAAGNMELVELLLNQGVAAGTTDGGGHTPLYSLANECSVPGAGALVRVLVQAGADVDASDGVKQCTPLHMAARRGNVEIARALLDCGAAIEKPDSLGDTPLRRAVNCGKTEVAALLLSKGANRFARGSKGLTPLSAARTEGMRRVLQSDIRR
jgi:hemoglobin